MANTQNVVLQWLTFIVAAVLLLGFFFNVGYMRTGKADCPECPTCPECPEIAPEDIASQIVVSDNEKINAIYDETFERDKVKAEAERLALDELDTKDFKKDLAFFLEDEIEEIEDIDYRDITDISVRDIDVNVDEFDEDEYQAEVTIEFKVYVDNYGDDDEEEKARLEVTFYVEDLNVDEDFEDAEFEDWSDFEITRCYGDLTC